MRLLGVRIGTDDLDRDRARYATLLGTVPAQGEAECARFPLARGLVELVRGEPGVQAVLFAREHPDERWPEARDAFHGISVEIVPPPAASDGEGSAIAIDHVVIFTPDPARAIALWRDQLGLRLAFDREFAERALRLMFFRSGGITLELACPLPAVIGSADPDRPYGVSYRVPSVEAHREALLAAGFDVSPVRVGNKPGTRVASVRSHTAGVATLILEAVVDG